MFRWPEVVERRDSIFGEGNSPAAARDGSFLRAVLSKAMAYPLLKETDRKITFQSEVAVALSLFFFLFCRSDLTKRRKLTGYELVSFNIFQMDGQL